MRILFVDDEQRRMEPVVTELEAHGHRIVFESTVDPALHRLRDPKQIFDLAIIDISMPSGKEFEHVDTDGGACTGVAFYDELRILHPTLKVVIYTNVADPGVEEYFKKQNPQMCRFIRKPNILPHELADEVERLFSGESL